MDIHDIKGLFSHLSKILKYPHLKSMKSPELSTWSLSLRPERKRRPASLKVCLIVPNKRLMRKWRGPFLGGHKGRALPSRNLESPLGSLPSLLYPLVCCFVSVLKSFLKRVANWACKPIEDKGPGFYFFCFPLPLQATRTVLSKGQRGSIEVADCLTLGTWSTG